MRLAGWSYTRRASVSSRCCGLGSDRAAQDAGTTHALLTTRGRRPLPGMALWPKLVELPEASKGLLHDAP